MEKIFTAPSKFCLFLIATFFFAAISSAQIIYETNADGSKSPKWKIRDRFGNDINKTDLKITPTGGQGILPFSNDCVEDYFHLYFIDAAGTGFNDATSGAARQAVACQVFNDIAEWIIPANSSNTVNIALGMVPWGDPFASGTLGDASAIYLYPQNVNCVGITDGMAWKSIISGTDPYSTTQGFDEYQIGLTGNIFAHGYVRINWAKSFSTALGSAPAANEYDLYSVILHEALHMLGVTGSIVQNGSGGIDPTAYTRFDLGITNASGVAAISNAGTGNCYCYNYNTAVNTTGGCANVRYRANALDIPVYAPATWEQGSSMTHFDPTCAPNTPYVVQPSLNMGLNRRRPELIEGSVMCSLGYSISNTYGVVTSGVIDNVRTGFTTCADNPLGIVGIDDGINSSGGVTFITAQTTALTTPNVLTNDFADACANNDPTNLDCLELLTPGAGVIVNNGNGTVTYTPAGGFTGNVLARYRPLCGTNSGSYAFIYFYVLPPNCSTSVSCNATSCNFICNGDFEAFTTGCDLDCYASNFRTLNNTDNTTDITTATQFCYCNSGSGNCVANFTITTQCPVNCSPAFNGSFNYTAVAPHSGLRQLHLAFGVSNVEAICLPLSTSLQTGTSYTISFWENPGYTCNGSNFTMNVIGSVNPPCLLSDIVPSDIFNYGVATTCTGGNTFTPIDLGPNSHVPIALTPGWVQKTFTYTPGTNINYLIFAGTPCTGELFIDDISVTPVLTATATSSVATICNGGTAQLGVTVTGNPASYTYAWSPATGLNFTNIKSPIASGVTATTTYTVTVTGCGGTTVSSSITINYANQPSPTANAGGTQNVTACSYRQLGGSPTASGGTSPYTYLWSPAAYLSSSTTANPTAVLGSSSTTYYLTVTDANSCTASASASATLNVGSSTGFLKLLVGNVSPSRGRVLSDMVVNNAGDVYGIGVFEKDMFFDYPNQLESNTSFNSYLVKYSPGNCGTYLWRRIASYNDIGVNNMYYQTSSMGHPYQGNLALDGNGNIYSSIHAKVNAGDPFSAFITKTTPAGTNVWNTGIAHLVITDMETEVTAPSNIYVAGYNSGTTSITLPGTATPIPAGRNYIARISTTNASLSFDWVTVTGWSAVTDGIPSIKIDADGGTNPVLFYCSNRILATYVPSTGAALGTSLNTGNTATFTSRFTVNTQTAFRRIYVLDGSNIRVFNYAPSTFAITSAGVTVASTATDITGDRQTTNFYVVNNTQLSAYAFTGFNSSSTPAYTLTYITTPPTATSLDKCIALNKTTSRVYMGGDFPGSSTTNNVTVNGFSFRKANAGAFMVRASMTSGVYAKTDETSEEEDVFFDEPNTPLSLENESPYVDLFPNPANEVLTLRTNIASGVEVSLFNMVGELVDKLVLDGSNEYRFSITQLPPGMYILYTKNDSNVIAKRFIKE